MKHSLLFLILASIATGSLSEHSTNRTRNSPKPEAKFVGFVTDPDGRGTISLVISCLITLLLCVWQALHLNVPKQGETTWEKVLTNFLWITIGIYAPELVVFTAWRQWSSAKLLGKIVKGEVEKEKEPNCALETSNATHNIGSEEVRVEKTAARVTGTKRKHTWTTVHSFFASTGGFAFEIDDSYDDDGNPRTPFLPPECPRRLTLTARGVALLAQCGLLPDIAEEEIQDKSKANNMAKGLVVVQASWMLVQVIGRLIVHLPVTLLEVNTVAHVLCAFLMYAMWWNKPLLPESPLIIQGDWTDQICAYMYMSSELSGHVEVPTVVSKSPVKKLFASLKVYSKVPEFERVRLHLSSDEQQDGAVVKVDAPCSFFPSSRRSLDDIRVIRESSKSSETAFFERRPRIAACDRAITFSSPVHLRRWELAAEAVHHYPILRSTSFILHTHSAGQSSCLHPQPAELIRPYIQNWPYDDLLRNVGGLTVGMILWLSNFIYGGLHAAAWNDHFPTVVEMWFWRASCSYISFAGGLWIILNWLTAAYPPLNDFWERWMDGAKGRSWGLSLGFVVFICGLSFGLARVYIVVEAFLSIRSLPTGAYDTPNWSEMIPHF